MSIITRYLSKEIALHFAATLLVLSLVIVGNLLVRLLSEANTGELPADLIGSLLWVVAIKQLMYITPVALLIGMMLAFSRLYRDSEMFALQAAGLTPRHFYRAIFSFALPLSALLAILIFFVSPDIEARNQALRRDINQRPEAAGIPPGEFVSSSYTGGYYTALAESIDPTHTVMSRFFIYTEEAGKKVMIWAKSAVLFIDSVTQERTLQIRNGHRYEFSDDSTTITQFAEHGVRIPLRDYAASRNLAATPTTELLQRQDLAAKTEWYWRISFILAAPLMTLLAFPLSYTAPRQGRYGKIALGILLYIVYANVLLVTRGMIEQGKLPLLSLWLPHLSVLGLSYWLLHKHYGKHA